GHQQIAVRAEGLVVLLEAQKAGTVLLLAPVVQVSEKPARIRRLTIRPDMRLRQAIDEREPRDRNEPLPLIRDRVRLELLIPVAIEGVGACLSIRRRLAAGPFIPKLNAACVRWHGRHEEPLPDLSRILTSWPPLFFTRGAPRQKVFLKLSA